MGDNVQVTENSDTAKVLNSLNREELVEHLAPLLRLGMSGVARPKEYPAEGFMERTTDKRVLEAQEEYCRRALRWALGVSALPNHSTSASATA